MAQESNAMDGKENLEMKSKPRSKRLWKWGLRLTLLICLVASGYGVTSLVSRAQRERQLQRVAVLDRQVNLQMQQAFPQMSPAYQPAITRFNSPQNPQPNVASTRMLSTPINQQAGNTLMPNSTSASAPAYAQPDQRYSASATGPTYGYASPVPQSTFPSNPSSTPHVASVSPVQSYPAQSSSEQITQWLPQTVDGKIVYRPVTSHIAPHPLSQEELAANSEVMRLLSQFQGAPEEKRESLRESLKLAVAKQFELKHADQLKRVERLEKELADANALLKKRSDRKDEIIDRRLAELLNTPDELAWDNRMQNTPQSTLRDYWQSVTPAPNYVPPALSSPSSSPYDENYPAVAPRSSGEFPNANTYPPGATSRSGILPSGSVPSATTVPSTTAEIDALNKRTQSTLSAGLDYLKAPQQDANAPVILDRWLVESGFDYMETLSELKELQGTDESSGEISRAKRAVRKSSAVWEAANSKLATELKLSAEEQSEFESELERVKALYEKAVVPEQELSKAKSALSVSKINREALTKQADWSKDFAEKSLKPLLDALAETLANPEGNEPQEPTRY